MTEETIAMTQKAIDRLSVIQQVVNRQLRQREAAVQLGLSIRQVKRLVVRFPGRASRAGFPEPGKASWQCPLPRAARDHGAGP